MTEFQQWLDDTYQAIKSTTRRDDDSYDTEAENEEFMEQFGINDRAIADRILCGIHCKFWNQVDDSLDDLYAAEGICLMSVFQQLSPEEVII